MKIILAVLAILLTFTAICAAEDRGTVLVVNNHEEFLVQTAGGVRLFEAHNYCYDVRAGDRVLFLDAVEDCDSNVIIGLETGKQCDVWCKGQRGLQYY
jgi:hypothetical protein